MTYIFNYATFDTHIDGLIDKEKNLPQFQVKKLGWRAKNLGQFFSRQFTNQYGYQKLRNQKCNPLE